MEWITMGYLVVNTVTDLINRKIYLWISVVYIVSGLVMLALTRNLNGVGNLPGIIPGLLLYLISRYSGESIGAGDALVVGVVGILMGLQGVMVTLGIGLLLCAGTGMGMWIFKKAGRKSRLPFVPFLFLGFLCLQFIIMHDGVK